MASISRGVAVSFTLLFSLLNLPLPPTTISSLAQLIQFSTSILGFTSYNSDLGKNPNPILSFVSETYDFIIVGAGSAGSVIANRLSNNGYFKVLVLEAGGDPLLVNTIPLLTLYNLHQNHTDWLHRNVPQVYSSYASKNNAFPLPRGKSLGGSSNLNWMLYIRGNPQDFDNWASLTGDSQWNYANVLEYFKKSENYLGNFPDPSYHGSGGPLTVSTQANYDVLTKEWMEAAREFGFNNSDPNGQQTSTFAPMDLTINDGQRESAYSAFLQPALNRPNLKVIRFAHVTKYDEVFETVRKALAGVMKSAETSKKIHLDSSNRATGVTYQRHGKTFTVLASKEIVISAGAINTPQLLMLSGIGPANHLYSLGIQPKVDLPGVGENYHDHVNALVGPFLLNETVSFNIDRDGATLPGVKDYALRRKGPLTFTLISGVGFFSTSEPVDPSWPNICTFNLPVGIHESFGGDMDQILGFKEGTMGAYVNDYIGRDTTWGVINLARPKTRGTIRLSSSNPLDKPLVDPRYYAEPDDINAMVEAFRFMVNFFENSIAWKKYNATLIHKHFPGCESYPLRSDEYYECYLRTTTGTMWHQCCTAKMGQSNDPMAVVDSNLRVFNVENLRVADASVMPVITNGNLNAPTIMIGEKAADLILQRWLKNQLY